jgi:hypothetical protein
MRQSIHFLFDRVTSYNFTCICCMPGVSFSSVAFIHVSMYAVAEWRSIKSKTQEDCLHHPKKDDIITHGCEKSCVHIHVYTHVCVHTRVMSYRRSHMAQLRRHWMPKYEICQYFRSLGPTMCVSSTSPSFPCASACTHTCIHTCIKMYHTCG